MKLLPLGEEMHVELLITKEIINNDIKRNTTLKKIKKILDEFSFSWTLRTEPLSEIFSLYAFNF